MPGVVEKLLRHKPTECLKHRHASNTSRGNAPGSNERSRKLELLTRLAEKGEHRALREPLSALVLVVVSSFQEEPSEHHELTSTTEAGPQSQRSD